MSWDFLLINKKQKILKLTQNHPLPQLHGGEWIYLCVVCKV